MPLGGCPSRGSGRPPPPSSAARCPCAQPGVRLSAISRPHMGPAPRPAPHLVVLLQQHGVGEALVQAQLRELPAGAADVQNQVRAGDVAEDVQEDLVGEAQQVRTARHCGRRRGRVAIAAQVLKTRGRQVSMGSPRAALGPASSTRGRSQLESSPQSVGKRGL